MSSLGIATGRTRCQCIVLGAVPACLPAAGTTTRSDLHQKLRTNAAMFMCNLQRRTKETALEGTNSGNYPFGVLTKMRII